MDVKPIVQDISQGLNFDIHVHSPNQPWEQKLT